MVVAQSPPPPVRTRPTTYREPTPPGPPDDKTAAWAFVWILFAFKMATLGIVVYMNPSVITWTIVVATSWFWLIVPAIAFAGPILFRWRLVKLRKRRAALRRSEWLVDPTAANRRY